MRLIEYTLPTDPTITAVELCTAIELELGEKLHKEVETDDISGFISTSSEGKIWIYLYEEGGGMKKVCTKSDAWILNKLEKVKKDKNLTGGTEIKKGVKAKKK